MFTVLGFEALWPCGLVTVELYVSSDGAPSYLTLVKHSRGELVSTNTISSRRWVLHCGRQTWLLFHNALSEGVVIDDILKYARMNKELAGVDDDTLEEDTELKRLVRAQAAELEILKERVSPPPHPPPLCLNAGVGMGRAAWDVACET